jgi:hypothetical protein
MRAHGAARRLAIGRRAAVVPRRARTPKELSLNESSIGSDPGPERGPARREELRRRSLTVAAFVVWGALLLTGLVMIARYKTRPGPMRDAPAHWPAASRLVPSEELSTLVMFVHPRCSSVRACFSELNIVMNRAQGRVAGYIVFDIPAGPPAGFLPREFWRAAGQIPGVIPVLDEGGVEAARFGAMTSGHLVLYDPEGRLQFLGGITESRGHAGDNMGRRMVLQRIDSPTRTTFRRGVFGCPFDDPVQGRRVPAWHL